VAVTEPEEENLIELTCVFSPFKGDGTSPFVLVSSTLSDLLAGVEGLSPTELSSIGG